MKLIKLLYLTIVIVPLAACSSINTSGESSFSPVYSGYVSPIKKPINASYKPVSMRYKISYITSFSYGSGVDAKHKTTNAELFSSLKVSSIGDHLSWVMNFKKYIENERVYSSDRPLLRVTLLTNKLGKNEGINYSSPALSAAHASKRKISKFKRQMRSAFLGASSMMQVLPESPIKSGDTIFKIDHSKFASVFSKMGPVTAGSKVTDTVVGWATLNGRKVILTSINGGFSVTVKGIDLQFRITGYSLIDPKTFAFLRSKTLIVGNSPDQGDKHFSFKETIGMSGAMQ